MEIKRCLVVEDHPQARDWVSAALNSAFNDLDITCAASLAEAKLFIKQGETQGFDLAILDIGLPDGSGIDLVAPLVTAGCEVVIASIFADDEHLMRALKMGAKGYILKDHPKDELVAMLKGILEGQPPLSPQIARRVLAHFSERQDDKNHIESNAGLTTRERDVLTLLAKGYTVRAVADLLQISPNTSAGYAKSIYRKLKVTSRAEATLEASRLGYVN